MLTSLLDFLVQTVNGLPAGGGYPNLFELFIAVFFFFPPITLLSILTGQFFK